MKIYFSGALIDEIEWLREIYGTVEDLGHVHSSDFIVTVDPDKFLLASKAELKESYKQARKTCV